MQPRFNSNAAYVSNLMMDPATIEAANHLIGAMQPHPNHRMHPAISAQSVERFAADQLLQDVPMDCDINALIDEKDLADESEDDLRFPMCVRAPPLEDPDGDEVPWMDASLSSAHVDPQGVSLEQGMPRSPLPVPDNGSLQSVDVDVEQQTPPPLPNGTLSLADIEPQNPPPLPNGALSLADIEAQNVPPLPQGALSLADIESPNPPPLPYGALSLVDIEAQSAPPLRQGALSLADIELPNPPPLPYGALSLADIEAQSAPPLPQGALSLADIEPPNPPPLPYGALSLADIEPRSPPPLPQGALSLADIEPRSPPPFPGGALLLADIESQSPPALPHGARSLSDVESPHLTASTSHSPGGWEANPTTLPSPSSGGFFDDFGKTKEGAVSKRRIAPDGLAYTRREFYRFFGGYSEWERAPPA